MLHLQIWPMKYSDHAMAVLSKNGYKLTNPRSLVIQVLESSNIPRNAYDIKKSASANLDIVSIYRTLSLLKDLNLVHEPIEGKFVRCQKFDCANLAHCHHQFTCNSCHEIKEIHVDDKDFVKKLTKLFPKLSINSHNFRFEGLCENCKK